MNLYDSVFESINKLIDLKKCQKLDIENVSSWISGDKNKIIFRSDAAYELGGGNKNGISGVILTDKIKNDEVILLGNDLNQIKKDSSYARIVFVNVDDEKMGTGNALYQSIRKIDYTRYHVFPDGFMMRISSMNQRESVLVAKDSLKQGMNFTRIGKFFIDAYHQNEAVKAVKIIFVTLDDFDYQQVSEQFIKADNITTALDHLLNKVKMDCHSCNLQVVCQEVEEKCKEDFPEEK